MRGPRTSSPSSMPTTMAVRSTIYENMEAVLSMCCWPVRLDIDEELDETSSLLRTATLPPYTYQSIATDEFRVVVLHPAQSFNDEIELHLQTRKRSDDKFYEAVSYTWGKEESTSDLLVHDEKFAAVHLHGQNICVRMSRYHHLRDHANATIKIRSNVATMLRYLRYKWLPRYLWIDAMCINQNDVVEKGRQVSHMGDIYRKSGRTLIWLGSSRLCPRPLFALESAARSRKADRVRVNSLDGPTETGDLSQAQFEIHGDGQDTLPMANFRDILSLPWFQRRWVRLAGKVAECSSQETDLKQVIQEVALSPRPKVVFGHDVMSFEDMTYFIDQLRVPDNDGANSPIVTSSMHMLDSMTSLQRRNSFRGSNFFTNIKHNIFYHYYQYHPRSNGAADFIQVLVSMSSAQCSDDRDRIYALNSLGGRPTVVDYESSTDKVFTHFAIEECAYSLETLYCCGAFPSLNLPSFVPDWRSRRRWIPIKSFEGRLPSHSLLSEAARQPNGPSDRPVFVDDRLLLVRSVMFTSMATKGPPLLDTWHMEPWDILKKFHQFYTQIKGVGTSPTDAHAFDRLVKTLTAGAIQSGANLAGWLQFGTRLRGPWRVCNEDIDNTCDCHDKSFCEYPQMHVNIHSILQRIDRLMQGRCTFRSQGGHWGIGPASMLSGDLIVALPNCRYPLLLRPYAPGLPGTFTIVGDCYITPFEGFEELANVHSVRPISIL